jgi:hypothetical protein
MARGKPVTLDNGKVFSTQKDAMSFFKVLLNSIDCNLELSPSHKYFDDLISLYKIHPEFKFKSGTETNILYFMVKNSGQYNTKCFHAVHVDGSQADWSYATAIKNKAKTNFQCFVDGARHLLELDNNYFRDSDFSQKCKLFIESIGEDETSIPNN